MPATDKEEELEALQLQRKRLQRRARQIVGTAAFLADVDVEQNAAQVALLITVKNGIAEHRAKLSA